MSTELINKWVFQIPLEDIRTTQRSTTSVDECICCGKKVSNPKYSVHLLTNGNIVSSDQPFAEDEDQGFFYIGSECIKRIPNNFYFNQQ